MKRKKTLSLFLAFLLAAAVIILTGCPDNQGVSEEPGKEPAPEEAPHTSSQDEGECEEAEMPESDPWLITLPEQEVLITEEITEQYLLYSSIIGDQTFIYSRSLESGSESTLFQYNEFTEKITGPNADLSPDQTLIAYIDAKGLHAFDLDSGEIETYIENIEPAVDETQSGKWSVENLTAWRLSEPMWSYDKSYISLFLESMVDGHRAFFDTETSEITNIMWSSYLRWSPVENAYAYTNRVYAGGMYRSVPGDPSASVEFFEGADQSPNTDLYAPFYEFCFSNNGLKVAFIYEQDMPEQKEKSITLALADSDGTGLLEVETDAYKSAPFFAPDDSKLYYFKAEEDSPPLLSKYDLSTGAITRIAAMPAEFGRWTDVSWTEEGYLAVSWERPDRTMIMFLVLDLKEKKITYASPQFDNNPLFLGLIK